MTEETQERKGAKQRAKERGSKAKRTALAAERVGEAFKAPKPGHYWSGVDWIPIADALNGPEQSVPDLDLPRSQRKALGAAYRAAEEQRLLNDIKGKANISVEIKRGRPPMEYNPEVAAEICVRLSKGQSLTAICDLPHMPSVPTVYGWIRKEASFASDYVRAREEQAHTLFDECLDIADDASNDLIENKDGDTTVNTIAVTRAKLRIDTRLRMAAKLSPKVYSERSETLGIGAGGTVNVQVNAMTIDARTLDAGQRDNLRRLLLEAKGAIIDV